MAELGHASGVPVIAVTHPLVRHKIGLLRDKDLSTKDFRALTNELGRLLAYEATADFPLEKTPMACWSGTVEVARPPQVREVRDLAAGTDAAHAALVPASDVLDGTLDLAFGAVGPERCALVWIGDED